MLIQPTLDTLNRLKLHGMAGALIKIRPAVLTKSRPSEPALLKTSPL